MAINRGMTLSKQLLKISFILCLGYFCFLNTASALVPPLSEEELQEQADLIVEGKVLSTEKVGDRNSDHCYIWQNYKSEFEIQNTSKGKAETKTITISYAHQEGDVNKDMPCVGGETSYWLSPNSSYKLYLKSYTVDEKTHYRFLNWSGVKNFPEEKEKQN